MSAALKPFQPVPFKLGSCNATTEVLEELGHDVCAKLIARHARNDWGDLGKEDRLLNDDAVMNGNGRVFSCYQVDEHRVYVITEEDRSRTTVLFSHEY